MGLIGVVLGGGLGWWATWTTTGRQIKAEHELRRAERRRADALPVASRLISATDELWAANQSVAMAIFDLITERRAYNQPDRVEYLRTLGERRVTDMTARKDAQRRALQAAAELAIISKELDEPADALVVASEFSPKASATSPYPSQEQNMVRITARQAFIEAARAVLIEDGRLGS